MSVTETDPVSDKMKCDAGHGKPSEDSLENNPEYELIGDSYYYTDKSNEVRYKFNQETQSWEEANSIEITNVSTTNESSVTTDKDGRQYYYAEGMYLCRDTEGNVFFMDENNEWKAWSEKANSNSTSNKWHFYKDGETFYRDITTNKVYKLIKETNKWELYEKKKRKKVSKTNADEEFDTDDEEELMSDEDEGDGLIPPGFNSDPNISFNGSIYTKFDPNDNMTYEWEVSKRAWFPKIDDDFMATYQMSYGFNPDGTKNENPLKFDDEADDKEFEEEEKKNAKKLEKETEKTKKPGWFEMDDAHNTKVYVNNLPCEMTESEFIDFMQKCGLVLKDPESQKYKIKMYTDSDGKFKGDALCTYIKIESVELALQILDGYRLGSHTINVERAKFTLKGDYNPELKPKKKRKKVLDKMQKKQEKLFDWHPDPLRGQRMKHENVVILRNVFDPKEFDAEAEKILSHKEAIRNQALTFGSVKKVELFDRHPEGVVKITFNEIEAADLCVATIDNRLYLKRKLVAHTWDGSTKYNIEETEEERTERIRKWDEFLEGRISKKT